MLTKDSEARMMAWVSAFEAAATSAGFAIHTGRRQYYHVRVRGARGVLVVADVSDGVAVSAMLCSRLWRASRIRFLWTR